MKSATSYNIRQALKAAHDKALKEAMDKATDFEGKLTKLTIDQALSAELIAAGLDEIEPVIMPMIPTKISLFSSTILT